MPGKTIMIVAAIGVVINTATALFFLSGKDHDLNIRGAFLHMAADAGISLGVVVPTWRGDQTKELPFERPPSA